MSEIEENEVLTINDINFIVGASSIDIQKENLSFAFRTLRESSSTKLPTGNGAVIVNINIATPKEDILSLHRLVVQVRRNPFLYIENKLIRQNIVPHWPSIQNMAFTLLNATIESIPGNVGLFNLSLQLKWFNYFPFTHNFLFREEWRTDWMKASEDDKSMLSEYVTDVDVKYVKRSLFDYIESTWSSTSFPITGFKKTFEDNFNDFNGFFFDLMPYPYAMDKSFPVNSPRDSKIYKRFYNELQAQAILNNFNIDVKGLLTFKDYYNNCLSGDNSLPEYLKEKNLDANVIQEMLSYDYFKLVFDVYKFVDIPQSLKDGLSQNLNKVINDIPEAALATERDETAVSLIPDIIKSNVDSYEKLLKCNPYFRDIAIQVLQKMVEGDNLTGTKYKAGTEYHLFINETDRSLNAEYGSATSLHKIKTPDGNSDAFALDLNLMSTGGVGNFIDKVSTKELFSPSYFEAARRVVYFHLDYGYVVNKYFKASLLWGGNFQFNENGYDSNSTQKAPLRIANAQSVLNFSEQDLILKRGENGLPPISNWRSIVYGSSNIGYDPVHIQQRISGSTSDVYNRLQSGWRPNLKNNSPVYNNVTGTYKSADGTIRPWYYVKDIIADRQLTEDDVIFFQNVKNIINSGWSYYTKDPSVNGVFTKKVEIMVPSTSGRELFHDKGFLGFADGSDSDLDTVLTKVSTTIKHITVTIPLAGQEFPTQQHLGSIEPQFNFEFITGDRTENRTGVGKLAQLIEATRITLQQNARNIKSIHDSWMCFADTFITRLTGSFEDESLFVREFTKANKKAIIHSSSISTIERQPGLSVLSLQLEESQPFIGEALVKVNVNDKNHYDVIYKKMIEKIYQISKSSDKSVNDLTYINNRDKTIASELPDYLRGNLITELGYAFNSLTSELLAKEDPLLNLIDEKASSGLFSTRIPYYTHTAFTGLTGEEISKLETLIQYIGYQQAFANLILFETANGGVKPTDLYGVENFITPKAKAFLDWEFSDWGYLSEGILRGLYTLGFVASAEIAALYGAYKGGELAGKAVLTPIRALLGEDSLIASAGETGYGVFWLLVAVLFSPVLAPAVGITASNVSDSFADDLFTPAYSSLIVGSYLKSLQEFTGQFDFVFSSAIPELGSSLISDFFSFDTSPLLTEEVYGLSGAAYKYLKESYYNKDGFVKNDATLGKNANKNSKLTTETFEAAKLSLIKQNIANILNSVIYDPFLMKFFDIVDLVAALQANILQDNKDCLPDLNLPYHPFWGKTYLTPPDFYYFNFYEDGQYSNSQYMESIYTDMIKDNVAGVKNFYDRIKEGENPNTASGDVSAGELSSSNDGDDNPVSEEFLSFMEDNNGKPGEVQIKINGYTNINESSGERDSLTFNQGLNTCNFLVSNFDRDATYTPQSTEQLIARIKKEEAFFGSKDGYANERHEIQKIIPNKDFALSSEDVLPDSMTHFYDEKSLVDLVKESLKDVISQKFTMKRAFPTYRLYLIEEDQNEDFLIKYDDFFHYNAVKEITLVKNKFIAADTAIIKLQNISGILDGTKRLTLKDTDYYYDNKTASGTNTSKGQKIEDSRKPEVADTKDEEPLGSIVLRPGINIQLRMGYGNDPNNLEVRMSGRIVDINFSENNDLIEISVQSFGVELEQQEKGLSPDSSDKFNLTHKLLGSLMFSPELKHFGRFEKGITSQVGESKDYSLDFKEYQSSTLWASVTEIYTKNNVPLVNSLYGIAVGGLKAVALPIVGFFDMFSSVGESVAGTWNTIFDLASFSFDRIQNFATKLLANSLKERVHYAMLSPQDDNLFPPHPKDYLERPNWQFRIIKNAVNDAWNSGIDSAYLKQYARTAINIALNPRLTFKELEYSIQNSTIFQMFHEMTLRHPGYVYAPLPYGREFRYTMFFGVPSQRYWSKPAHPFFIKRVNAIRKAISSPMNDQLSVDSTKKRKFEQISTFREFSDYIKYNIPFSDSYYQELTKEVTERSINSFGDKTILQSLNIHTLQDALLQYYQALTLRFEPFRRYHLVSDKSDIILNNISLSEYDFPNAVGIKYYSNVEGKEQEDIALVKIHENMPDNELRLKQLDYTNVNSRNMALRYGVGELVHEVKKMYGGSLFVLGNPRMKPWDICYLIDRYNDMAGLIEIEEIVEKLSFETGYITEIKPNAVVFANEVASFPIIEGLKAIVGGITREEAMVTSNFKGNDFFDSLTTNYLTTKVIDTLDFIYDGQVTSGISVSDISSYIQFDINQTIGLPVTSNQNISTLQSVFMSGAWLLGGYIYINKATQGQSIIVYPLMKNGSPYTAGIPKGRPDNLWTVFRGQLSSFMNDLTKGSTDFLSYWKLLGVESLKALSQDSFINQQVANQTNRVR